MLYFVVAWIQFNWCRIAANLKLKVKCALCFYKLFKSGGKWGKEGKLKWTKNKLLDAELPLIWNRAGWYISCELRSLSCIIVFIIAEDNERDIASLVCELRLCVLNATPFENRWWRFAANQGTGFTDEMRMHIAWDISPSPNLKVKVKCTQSFYKLFKTEGKRGKEGKLKRPPTKMMMTIHGDTGITGVITPRLTGGKISSPSQPYSTIDCQFKVNVWINWQFGCPDYAEL